MMAKWEKRYIAITGIIEVVVVFLLGYFLVQEDETMIKIMCSVLLLAPVAIAVLCIAHFVPRIKCSIHNVMTCDDKLFNEIDQYKKCWDEDKQSYYRQIQIINLYYKKHGKVDELVKDKEIDKLYARADFLKSYNSFVDDYMVYLYSFAISVLSLFIGEIIQQKSVLLMFLLPIVIVFLFFYIISLKYAEKGQFRSYKYLINEYEMELLRKKISKLEKKLTINEIDEQFLKTKQIAINELIRIRQKKIFKKQKEKLEHDLKQVNQLDLCIGDDRECYIQSMYVNGIKCCLAYDKKKGKENNYTGGLNLISQDFSILYQILSSYELISYR